MHATMGESCDVAEDVTIGHRYTDECKPAVVGDDATIRSGAIIYADVVVGDGFMTGHNVLVREHTVIGDDVVVGTDSVVEGHARLGDGVTMETGTFVPTDTEIGDHVFLGPHSVLTNDMYPLRRRNEYTPDGPTLAGDVTVGANATILPGVEVGEGSMIGAGTVVTDDVPAWHLAIGNPATIDPLPDELRVPNRDAGEE